MIEASANGENPSQTDRRAARWLLAAACALALARLWRLDAWSLWYDEVLTWADLATPGGLDGLHNPLGYRLVGLAVALCGGTPDAWNLRIVPALAGIACVPATWWAFRRWSGDLRAAAAALLVAASAWHIYWSQTARFYTLAQLVSLVGAGLCLRGLQTSSLARVAAGLAVAALAALFHPSAALLVPALLGAGLWVGPLEPAFARRARVVLGGIVALGALAAAPFAWRMYAAYSSQKGQSDALDSVLHYAKTTGFHATPLLLAGALCGAWVAWRRRDRAHLAVFATIALAASAALLCALQVRVSAQYVFFLLPWIALLAVVGAADAAGRAARHAGAWIFVLVVPALVSSALYATVRHGERPQWREAYELVDERRGADDLVVGMEAAVAEFEDGAASNELRHPRRHAVLDHWRVDELRRWARAGRAMWIVVNPEQVKAWPKAQAEVLERFLRDECRLERVWPLYVESRDLSVWVWRHGG